MSYFGIPLRNGVPIGLGSIAGFGIAPFDPSQLFSAGEQGAWYDPSDLTTLFTDSAGTTPVTAVEQFVGRMNDKSGRGNHATSTGTKRPKLAARYNLLAGTDTLATQSVTTAATTYTLRFGGTGSIALSGTATGTYSAGTHSITATAGTLTLTVTGSVTTADLRPASQATGLIGPTYQRVVDAATYDTAGFLPYLQFDGIDDSMSTGSIDFTATDKMTVWAGVRKLSAGTLQLVELSASAAANNGAFSMPQDVGTSTWTFSSRGTNAGVATSANNSYVAPITTVNTGIGNISGDVARLRVNGVQVATDAADQGSGNYGNYPLFIGARDNSTLYFNGWLTSLIVRGAQSTQSQIEATESWVNQRTGAF